MKYYGKLLKTKEARDEEEKEIEEITTLVMKGLEIVSETEEKREFTIEEIEKVVDKLKPKKAKDEEGWQNEHMLYGGSTIKNSLKILFNMIIRKQKIPNQWEKVRIKSIAKDQSKSIKNRRGLFLTNVVSKVMERLLKNRNEDECRKKASPFQCGGVKGRSTVDNTFILTAIIQRNQYMGKPTYLVFMDLEKCFDQLWLEDGVAELWRNGMTASDAQLIYEMNKKSKVIIETPVGRTKSQEINNTVKQGTIFGPEICGKVTGRVNDINEKVITPYGPRIEIQCLVYLDDISSGGDKEEAEKTIRNCHSLETFKKATVRLDKSGYVIVKGKKNEKNDELISEVKNGKIQQKTEAKYLGTWFDETGKYAVNLEKNKGKMERAIKKVEEMASAKRVGKLATELRLELYEKVISPSLLYNIQVWPEFTNKEMAELEKTQGKILRRLLNLPSTMSYKGILWETGVWPIKEQIIYKKLMLYHNILKSDEERILRQVILEQEYHPIKGCWVENLKEESRWYQIEVKKERVELKSKATWKKEVKEKIILKTAEKMGQENTTKMRSIVKGKFGRKKYLQGSFSQEEVKELMKIKLHMIECNENFRREEKECSFCKQINSKETTEHVMFECPELQEYRDYIDLENIQINTEITGELRKMLMMYRIVTRIMI